MDDADIEFVDVGGKCVGNSLLELSYVFMSSEFANDGEAGILDIENGFIDSFDVMLRDFHPGESTIRPVLCREIGLFETGVEFEIFLIWVSWSSFNHH